MIETNHVAKTYGRKSSAFQALKDISLAIKTGESVAITGKSGSGKSTLMHLLALLDKPSTGEILLDGRNTTELRERELDRLRNREFGFVFQQFYLNGRDSVLANVMLPLKIAGVSYLERRKRAMAALEAVEMTDKAKSRAGDMSGGQKQRICIARALVNNPSIIFADEPTGNLDSTTGAVVEDTLFNLHREKGITLIIVTHDPDLARKCDRQIEIHDGEITSEKINEHAKEAVK